MAQFARGCARSKKLLSMRILHQVNPVRIDLTIQHWLTQLNQCAAIVIPPAEVSVIGSRRLYGYKWHATGISLHERTILLGKQLLDFKAQSRLAHAGWSKDHHNRTGGRFVDCRHKLIFCSQEQWMRHCEETKCADTLSYLLRGGAELHF